MKTNHTYTLNKPYQKMSETEELEFLVMLGFLLSIADYMKPLTVIVRWS